MGNLRYQRKTLPVSLLFLAAFSLVATSRSSFVNIDENMNIWATSIQTPSLTVVAEIIDYVFDTPSVLLISLSIAVYLTYKNKREKGLLLIGAMLGDAAVTETVKTLVHSARPLNGLISLTSFSFPSRHTSGSVAFCGILAYLGWQRWRTSGTRALLSILFIAVTLVVGFDRIYLNVHWFSDVLGGYLLGAFWLTFSISTYQYLNTWLIRKGS